MLGADRFAAGMGVPTVVTELEKCAEPKRSGMLEKLGLIAFEVLPETVEVEELAYEYIKGGVLGKNCIDDCFHIGYAVVNHCDAIVSWNFKHLVNFKIINRIKVVNSMNHYKEIGILTPTMLLEEEEDNENQRSDG